MLPQHWSGFCAVMLSTWERHRDDDDGRVGSKATFSILALGDPVAQWETSQVSPVLQQN